MMKTKTFDYYMALPYRLVLIPDTDESGFVAFYPELPGCITCGEDIFKAVANAVDAKKQWLSIAIEDGVANALAECTEKEVRVIDKAPRPGADGMQIAFLHPKSSQGVVTELCEKAQ